VHFDGERDVPMPLKPLPLGVRAPSTRLAASVAARTGFSAEPLDHPDAPPVTLPPPARKLSQIPAKSCAVFLATGRSAQDEKKHSRRRAKK
jgi:hypothetical protein